MKLFAPSMKNPMLECVPICPERTNDLLVRGCCGKTSEGGYFNTMTACDYQTERDKA